MTAGDPPLCIGQFTMKVPLLTCFITGVYGDGYGNGITNVTISASEPISCFADGEAVDWTTKGAVTPLLNQDSCGSCWAFSTTGSLEDAWSIVAGNVLALGVQQLVDSDTVDPFCDFELMGNAFVFAEENTTCTEASHTCIASKGSCKAEKKKRERPEG